MDEREREQLQKQQYLDQREEELINNAPRLWRRLYVEFEKEGFDKDQALALLFHFMFITHRGD